MANVLDYVTWRGDVPFSAVPVCDVDALIFAELTYIDYTNLIPAVPENGSLTLAEAVRFFFSANDESQVRLGEIIPHEIVGLFRACGSAPRFCECRLTTFVNILDEKSVEQFSALTFLLPDGKVVAAFRGTDDTIVGWKEDFQMSFRSPVPAQERAAAYLTSVGEQYPDADILVCGHSKGGNLAVWASAHTDASVRGRIRRIYNLDGPGFLQTIEENEGFREIRPKIRTIVPECSVVGMFLDHDEKYCVVRSTRTGIWQHDGMSWEVLGPSFVEAPEVNREFRRVNSILSRWIESMDDEKRRAFIDAFFSILTSTNANTLTELAEGGTSVLRAFQDADAETRQALNVGLRLLLGESRRTLYSWIRRHAAAQEAKLLSDKSQPKEKESDKEDGHSS